MIRNFAGATPSLTGICFCFVLPDVFEAAPSFLSSRVVFFAVIGKRAFCMTQEQSCVDLMQKVHIKYMYNQTVTETLEQCCKVTVITAIISTLTEDVNNEIIQMKCSIITNHANEIGARLTSSLQ